MQVCMLFDTVASLQHAYSQEPAGVQHNIRARASFATSYQSLPQMHRRHMTSRALLCSQKPVSIKAANIPGIASRTLGAHQGRPFPP